MPSHNIITFWYILIKFGNCEQTVHESADLCIIFTHVIEENILRLIDLCTSLTFVLAVKLR